MIMLFICSILILQSIIFVLSICYYVLMFVYQFIKSILCLFVCTQVILLLLTIEHMPV